MKRFVINLEEATRRNENFQLVLMHLQPNDNILPALPANKFD
ncbi:MAG: hypothetical protein AAB537_00215 [Patescibacteria group bacterium]